MNLNKNSKRRRFSGRWQTTKLVFGLLLLLLLLNGCGGATPFQDSAEEAEEAPVVEVEVEGVTVEEVVEEEEEMAEEAAEEMADEEVEIEIEVEKEVEVETIVEVELVVEPTIEAQPTTVFDLQGTAVPELGESLPDDQDISATGSEEDEGSPFTSTSGKKGGVGSTEEEINTRIAWLSAAEELDPLTVRVFADHADSLAIYKVLSTDQFRETIILTRNIMFYSWSPSNLAQGEETALFLELAPERWEALIDSFSLEEIAQQADNAWAEPAACINCPEAPEFMNGERLTLITPNEVLRFDTTNIEEASETDPLANLDRLLQIVTIESRVRVRAVARQIE